MNSFKVHSGNLSSEDLAMTARLFTELQLGELTLSNRICVPPMCQFRAEEGLVQSWHKVHYGKLVGSGAGMGCCRGNSSYSRGADYTKMLGALERCSTGGFQVIGTGLQSGRSGHEIVFAVIACGTKGKSLCTVGRP